MQFIKICNGDGIGYTIRFVYYHVSSTVSLNLPSSLNF